MVLLRAHQSPHAPAPNHTLHSYSGRGPTINGRIKPDVMGPTGIQTAFTSNTTSLEYFGGTDAAAPSVAGACSRPAAACPTRDSLQKTYVCDASMAWEVADQETTEPTMCSLGLDTPDDGYSQTRVGRTDGATPLECLHHFHALCPHLLWKACALSNSIQIPLQLSAPSLAVWAATVLLVLFSHPGRQSLPYGY